MTIDELRTRIAELNAPVAAEAARACGGHYRLSWRNLFVRYELDGIEEARNAGATPQQARRWLAVHQEIATLEGQIARIERAERLAPRPRAA